MCVGKAIKETKVVEHLVKLKQTAEEAGIPVFYSTHYYTENDSRAGKIQEYPIYRDEKEIYNTKYTVIVHYAVPKGDWDEYDI